MSEANFLDWHMKKGGVVLRIDKFLKISRLIKRRTVASEACTQGRVLLNGKEAKPGAEVKLGDIIEIRFGSNTSKVVVEYLSQTVNKQESKEMYSILDE